MSTDTKPGQGDVILCVSAEIRDLRTLHPTATLVTVGGKALDGRTINGRLFDTELAGRCVGYKHAISTLQRSALKTGGDTTVHHLHQPTVYAGEGA